MAMTMHGKIRPMKFNCYMDALKRDVFLFTGLNGRVQGQVHGRGPTGRPSGWECATIEDVLHSMGCDLFGGTQYEISIQVKEIPDGSKREEKIKKKER